MRQEIVGSTLAHAFLALFLVFLSTPGTLPPPVSPEDIMLVTPVDALPAQFVPAPEAAVPTPAEDAPAQDEIAVPSPEPEAVPIAQTKPAEEPKPKEPPKPRVEESPAQTESAKPASDVYESTLKAGTGTSRQGSLLGLPAGTPGGRPASYPDRVANKVYYMWNNPVKHPDPASCSVVLRIDQDGRASQIALEQTSGMPAFDNSTLRAVYASAPYPPFPRSMSEPYIVMRIIFEYVP